MPRSEPSASPSGPSWAVSRKRSRSRISATTRSMSEAVAAAASLLIGLLACERPLLEQLRNAHSRLDGGVVVEAQRRRPLHARLGGNPRLDHAVRRAQAGERRLALLLIAEHADVHLRGAEIWAGLNRSHGDESDAWIAQLGADRCADHLAKHLIDAAHARRGHPTCSSLQGLLDLFGAVELEHVLLLDVRVALEDDPALLALLDLLHVVFEAAQGAQFAVPDHRALADQADAGVALDLAVGDDAAGDAADFRGLEGLFDLGLAENLLDLDGLEQALHRVAQVFGDFVDHRVGADVDALAVRGLARIDQGPHVEADDDRFGGRGEHHVGLVDSAGLRMDDVDPHLLLRDLGYLVLQRLERARHVGLEDDVELLDLALLGAGEHLLEADLAGPAAGERLGLQAVGAFLR